MAFFFQRTKSWRVVKKAKARAAVAESNMGPYNKLAALLGGQIPQRPAAQAPLGSGMAAQAAAILQSRPYQLHVQEAKALGEQPMDPIQFMQMMQQRQQTPYQ